MRRRFRARIGDELSDRRWRRIDDLAGTPRVEVRDDSPAAVSPNPLNCTVKDHRQRSSERRRVQCSRAKIRPVGEQRSANSELWEELLGIGAQSKKTRRCRYPLARHRPSSHEYGVVIDEPRKALITYAGVRYVAGEDIGIEVIEARSSDGFFIEPWAISTDDECVDLKLRHHIVAVGVPHVRMPAATNYARFR